MAEFQVRSDAVDVEHIMRQIRQRIQEKRGVDYSEEELRALASVKLEKFMDPSGLRSDLVQQFRLGQAPGTLPSYAFEDSTIYDTHRGLVRRIRALLNPILKLFFNPGPIVDALHIQAKLNQRQQALDALRFEIMHNLVLELTRTTLEVRNLRMRLDAMAGRLDFDERRQRAFEGVVEYRKPEPRAPQGQARQPSPAADGTPAGAGAEGDEGGQRTKRRRRRRRRVPSAGMPETGSPGSGESGGGGQGGPPEGGGEAPSQ